MNHRRIFLSIVAVWGAMLMYAVEARSFRYYPDGREIVCKDGTNKYTRALYGGYTEYRLETSDRPIFGIFRSKSHRNIRFWLVQNGVSTPLEQTTHCEARYSAGKREYILTDDSWGKAQLRMVAMVQVDSESAIWQFEGKGLAADVKIRCVVCDVLRPNFKRHGDMNSDPADSFDPAEKETNKQTIEWSLGNGATYVALDCDKDGQYTLFTPAGTEAETLYAKAWAHHEWLENNIVFDSPDPYINTLGGVLTAASDGAWDGEVWLHGAIVWRMHLNGWRAGYLGDVMGWPERSRSHFSAYAASQITDIEPRVPMPALDPDFGLSRAAKTWGTDMYSTGYIGRYPNRKDVMHHYDMNLNYIDELLWHFEYDADTAYLREMWPVLTRHLAWEKRNYDPDDDGLYDAYCCIWASDGLFYNSGAVSHSTAYNYRGFTLAARIAEILGEDPTYYRAEAEKTLKAMNSRLWLPERGHWVEYEDFMGLKRKHEHAALWSIYTPIDCGTATAEQAFQATQYIDSCIPHIPVLIEGAKRKDLQLYTVSTTDWLPYDWSINNVAAEEVMHTALAYFQAGRAEEGFALMKANILDQAYLGGSPGNFGQITYYDKARGELYRDFSDNCGISARTLIQGLYGIIPNALDGRCILRPGFPESWKKASVSTPYFRYTYRREGNKDIYEVEQNFTRPLQIVLRQNTGDGGYIETVGSSEKKQVFVVAHPRRKAAPKPIIRATRIDNKAWGNNFDDVQKDKLEAVDMSAAFNSNVSDVFKNFYLTPRSPYTTLQIPVHGIGEWCHPETKALVDETPLRRKSRKGVLETEIGIPFRVPAQGRDIAYTSLWGNYPDAVTVPLEGKATHAYLMMAGTTNPMQSRIDNGLVIAHYTDGSADTLHLYNPHNWCPIEQDYYEDGLAFHAAQPRPYRIDFSDAHVTRELLPLGEHYGRQMPGGTAGSYNDRSLKQGAGILLDMPLDGNKTLSGLTVRTLANDVVIGLMAVTLQR